MKFATLDDFLANLTNYLAGAKEKLSDFSGTFCIETHQGRALYALLDHGALSLPETCAGPFDCTVSADEKTLVGMLNGEVNPVMALITRKVSVRGDFGKLLAMAKRI